MKEISVGLSLMVTNIIVATLFVLFKTYIILDIVKLFEIPKLSELVFYQMFGLVIVINLLTKSKSETNKDDKDDFAEKFSKGIYKIFTEVFVILAFWGIAYGIAYIIK